MRGFILLAGCTALVALVAFVILPVLGLPRTADAQREWLKEFDEIAAEFSGEFVVEDGDNVPLEGPRRITFYRPTVSELNPVFEGAIYALHISGNPEVIIAIENSRDAEDPEKANLYIEVSRLSGAAINVLREGEVVAEFPRAASVPGAYVGMTR